MRLFIAIELEENMRRALLELQSQMRRGGMTGRFTKEENLHLTLAFLGEYGDPDRVLDVMETVPFEPLGLQLSGFGRFGDLYWAGLKENPALAAYVSRLRRALAEAGIPYDRKRFSPHITLLRRGEERRGRLELRLVGAKMEAAWVSLMQSRPGKNGMVYTELGSVRARDE